MPDRNTRKKGSSCFGILLSAFLLAFLSVSFPTLASSTTNFTVTSPANGATKSGTISITGTAGSEWVNVHAYTTKWASLSADVTPSTNGSYTLPLNTTQLANGTNSINIVAFSVAAGKSGGTSVTNTLTLNVQNVAVTTTVSAPPQSSIASNTFTVSSPANGATKSGTISITGTAGSEWVNVHAYTSGWASLSADVAPSTNGSYTLSLNTTPLANGTNSINIVAFSVAPGKSGGTSVTNTLTLNVQNATASTTASTAATAGVCGSMNGTTTNAAPASASGKCSAGAASAMGGSGNGPFTWSCAGSNGGATAQCATIAPSSCGTAPIGSSYQLVFDDEFNGTNLDTTKWSTGWLASGITPPVNSNEEECYDPAQVTVNNGLNLTAIAKNENCGSAKTYASGMINTNGKFQFTYGYFEALIYLPPSGTQIANWPAFWADGTGSWPTTGEMDIMEGLSGQACSHFHDPSGGPGFCASGNYSGWHIYAGLWQPGSVSYYYDNVLVGSITQGITSAPMFLILNNAMSAPNNYGGPIVAPADMQVKWVHVYSNASGAAAVTPEAGYAGPGGSTTCN